MTWLVTLAYSGGSQCSHAREEKKCYRPDFIRYCKFPWNHSFCHQSDFYLTSGEGIVTNWQSTGNVTFLSKELTQSLILSFPLLNVSYLSLREVKNNENFDQINSDQKEIFGLLNKLPSSSAHRSSLPQQKWECVKTLPTILNLISQMLEKKNEKSFSNPQ